MPTDKSNNSEITTHVLIILLAGLCIGVYLICTTVLIAQDGVGFIEYTKKLQTGPLSEVINQEYQHPGYSILILGTHKLLNIFHQTDSVMSWIYCGQAISLLSRLAAMVLLYFIGREIVGSKISFFAVLIFMVLPAPAEYGSDVLSDWPHLSVLLGGFWVLLKSTEGKKWWMFGLAGAISGIGYMFRPECIQLVVVGLSWLCLQLFWSKRCIKVSQASAAMLLLVLGFLITVSPYVKLKGSVFPKKNLLASHSINTIDTDMQYNASIISTPKEFTKSIGKLIERLCEIFMWFFILPMLIGICCFFRKKNMVKPKMFLMLAIILLNIILLILLHSQYNYLSRRHVMVMAVFLSLFVPPGLQKLTSLRKTHPITDDIKRSFVILVIAGMLVCMPKLLRPIRNKKNAHRQTAVWLSENIDKNAIVAVPDYRICFYAGLSGIEYKNDNIPQEAKYVVKIYKKDDIPEIKPLYIIEGYKKRTKVAVYAAAGISQE